MAQPPPAQPVPAPQLAAVSAPYGYPPQGFYYPQPQPQPIQISLAAPSAPAPYGYPAPGPVPYGYPIGYPQPGLPPPGYGYPPGVFPGPGPIPAGVPAPAPGPAPAPAPAPAAAPAPAPPKDEVKKVEVKDFHGGTFKIVLHSARKLFDTNCLMSQSPFVRFTMGKNVVESEVMSGAGVNCSWKDPTFYFTALNPTDSILIQVINSDFPCNKDIGEVVLNVDKLLSQLPESSKKKSYPLSRDGSRVAAGDLELTITFVPPIKITVHEASKLYDSQLVGKQDPYVVLTYKNGCGLGDPGTHRTKVHEDGDKFPKWEETFQFHPREDFTKPPVVNNDVMDEKVYHETTLLVEVWNDNVVVDAQIGYVEIPTSKLIEAKRTGKPQYFQLFKGSVKDQGKQFGGEICLSVN